MNIIEVKNLTKRFGEVTAAGSLTFHEAKVVLFGLPGPDGAGKTITIRMLCCPPQVQRRCPDSRSSHFQKSTCCR